MVLFNASAEVCWIRAYFEKHSNLLTTKENATTIFQMGLSAAGPQLPAGLPSDLSNDEEGRCGEGQELLGMSAGE